MRRMRARFLVLILGMVLSGVIYPQQLNLFEEIETDNSRAGDIRNRQNREARSSSTTPEFTLVGTSRIGSRYSAIIQHRGGNTLVVKVEPVSITQIPGYAGYTLVDIGATRASIRYPENVPCVEFSEQGVSCDSTANIAALSLANAKPLPPSATRESTSQVGRVPPNELQSEEARDPPINPFEALRDQSDNVETNNGGDRSARFTPRRIAPEDVPSGMRVVSTPFGDRLVEQ